MGEANLESRRLIADVLGCESEDVINADGTMSLRMGDIVITAEPALWNDFQAFLHQDDTLSVVWAAQIVRIPPAPRGLWTPEILPDPFRGKARQVF